MIRLGTRNDVIKVVNAVRILQNHRPHLLVTKIFVLYFQDTACKAAKVTHTFQYEPFRSEDAVKVV